MKEIHNQGARLANVDVNGLTPLHHAARLGRKEVVKYIVDNGETLLLVVLFYLAVIKIPFSKTL